MNKLKIIPLFIISLLVVIFGIFEYAKYKFALFIFLTVVFFVMLLITNAMTDGMDFIDRHKTQLRPVSLVFFILVIFTGIILKLSVYMPLGNSGVNNIDCFEFIIFGVAGSWYILFLKTFKK
ncbi:MAG: hypothetical protein MJ159_00290 [Treponemataceae bacterium]|nr:hypothetical protein [Treponemataceae bacterium]